MKEYQLMVAEFFDKLPKTSYFEQCTLRLQLLTEEVSELAEALLKYDKEKAADALADLLYVVLGTGVFLNIDLEPIFKAVHKSNMTKVVKDDPRVKDKGKNYQPPKFEVKELR